MPQINKGDTFADGQQVTAARLNQLIDSATILVDSITAQTAITAGTVDTADQVNINDNSASALRKATIGDLLGSNVSVVTSSVTAGSGSDIVVTPNDATIVTGSTYTSADGLTVVVTTAAAHGLSVGQVLLISAAGAGYNGTFRLTVAAGSSFTYVMNTAATAGSGSLAYTKKATNKVAGNFAVTQNLYVDGNIGGNATFEGNANFTGTLNVNGNVGYLLTEIYEEVIPSYVSTTTGNFTAIWSSLSFTKPVGEVWVFELRFNYSNDTVTGAGVGVPFGYGIRYSSETAFTGTYKSAERVSLFSTSVSVSYSGVQSRVVTWSEPAATALTSNNVVFDTCTTASVGQKMFSTTVGIFAGYPSTPMASSTFKIYKYRTA